MRGPASVVNPAERRLFVDWPSAAAGVVGGLRQAAAGAADDTRLESLVSELGQKSPEFETLWKQADVGFRPAGVAHFGHPRVGDLRRRRNRFLIPDSNGQHLQIYHAPPGTDAAEKLSRLAAS
ncbi:hypothetical protein [Mycolicibacterium sp.]